VSSGGAFLEYLLGRSWSLSAGGGRRTLYPVTATRLRRRDGAGLPRYTEWPEGAVREDCNTLLTQQ